MRWAAARRFGLMTLASADELEKHELITHLGPEPLSKDFSPKYLKEALSKRKTPLKVALMDQTVVVGVGNIYASEALYMSKLSPFMPANEAIGAEKKLIQAIQTVLNAAIQSGGSTLRDYVRSSGELGYFQHHFQVYDRSGETCMECGGTISKAVQANRSTYFCHKCQSVV